jgi:hypothetical protein
MPLKFVHTDEKITRRAGLTIVDEFCDRIKLHKQINQAFRTPGSNRGFQASSHIQTLIHMFIDGALHLEDVRSLQSDISLQDLLHHTHYPTSDALGDWSRRNGGTDGEQRAMTVNRYLHTYTTDRELTLDVDGTIIEADKGDGTKAYEGTRGYHPLLGIIANNAMIAASEFRFGHHSPQVGIPEFIDRCQFCTNHHIKYVRIDSAGYNHDVINYCTHPDHALYFTITADHDVAVMHAVYQIPKTAWKQGKNADGTPAQWEVAETIHTTNDTTEAFRLVIKRTPRTQFDLFEPYHYWIIASNLSREKYSANDVILFHQQRGEAERIIGELKHHFNLDHFPCGQFDANALYFACGILAYNIVQLIKLIAFGKQSARRSIRTLRYHILHLAGRIVSHARYTIARIAAPIEHFEQFIIAYRKIKYAPLVPT